MAPEVKYSNHFPLVQCEAKGQTDRLTANTCPFQMEIKSAIVATRKPKQNTCGEQCQTYRIFQFIFCRKSSFSFLEELCRIDCILAGARASGQKSMALALNTESLTIETDVLVP